jgi:hypothetical protein
MSMHQASNSSLLAFLWHSFLHQESNSHCCYTFGVRCRFRRFLLFVNQASNSLFVAFVVVQESNLHLCCAFGCLTTQRVPATTPGANNVDQLSRKVRSTKTSSVGEKHLDEHVTFPQLGLPLGFLFSRYQLLCETCFRRPPEPS